MITYLDLEPVLNQITINFKSMDQTIQAMRDTMMDTNINLTWAEINETYQGYQNTVDLLRENMENLFEKMNAIINSDGGPKEEGEKEELD